MAIFAASLADHAMAVVNCGGHYDADCAACPAGNGELWCHGDCAWVNTAFFMGGQCVQGVPMPETGIPGVNPTQAWYNYFVGFSTSAIIMLIFACAYNQKVIKGPPSFPKVNAIGSNPRRGLFDCLWKPDTCLYVTFCMPVVAAKNYYAADVCPFWPGCILTFLGTYSPFYCVTVCVRAMLSGRVQDNMGMKHQCWKDCLFAAFCFPCDVGRESLEVDEEVGADVKCCCSKKAYCCSVEITPRVVAEVKQLIAEVKVATWGCFGY